METAAEKRHSWLLSRCSLNQAITHAEQQVGEGGRGGGTLIGNIDHILTEYSPLSIISNALLPLTPVAWPATHAGRQSSDATAEGFHLSAFRSRQPVCVC